QLYRTILTVRIKCYNAFSKASSRIIEIGVEGSGTAYQPFLLLKEGNTSMSLGKVDLDNNLLTLISSDRWLPSNLNSITEIGNIASIGYFQNGVLKMGILSVFEDATKAGQFYLKAGPTFIESLKNNYPKIYSKLSEAEKDRFAMDYMSGDTNI